jgi:formyltetrahydrofolate-dependent phosphoribosylglycinamide formyltransferase
VTHPRIAVLVSGGGRSLENLQELIQAGKLDVEIGLVICDRAGAFALQRAERLGIPSLVLPRRDYDSHEAYSNAVFAAIESAGVADAKPPISLVVLAGFLRLLLLAPGWSGRVINIHPALLPAFGGKGYYGDHVHQAVLARGVQVTGCTVHYVDDIYDNGKVLLQRWIPVPTGIDHHALADLVFAEETVALPEAIRLHFAATPPA